MLSIYVICVCRRLSTPLFDHPLTPQGVATPLPVQEKCENLTLEGVFPQDAKVFVVSNPGWCKYCVYF